MKKLPKWFIYVIVGYSIAFTAVEKISPVYKLVAPKISYVLGIQPDADSLLVQRHSFLAGLYVYNIFNMNRNDSIRDWYPYYRDEVGRLFGTLETLGFKVTPEMQILKDEKISLIDRFYIYQDLRNQFERFLEKKGIGAKHLFFAGYDLSVASNTSNAEIARQSVKTATESINRFKKTFPNRLPDLPIMELNTKEVWKKNVATKAAVETINRLKDYFNGRN